MLHILALLAATSVEPTVSTAWLQARLDDPQVRIIDTGSREEYDRAHMPGARFINHMELVGGDHRLLSPDALAKALSKAGAADGTRVVLYGDRPMETGWLYMTLAAIGHGGDVSMLDGGIRLWQDEKRPTSTAAPPSAAGMLTIKPAPDVIVDAPWVRTRLESPSTRVLDVRTTQEWNAGHLPGATLILWQDLYADRQTLKFKSPEEIRALLAGVGVGPDQECVTYCAVGMRASLMYWAARSVGVPARVYVGSWQDWQRDSSNPIIREPIVREVMKTDRRQGI
jgi:thiosulfate/3-mercaptopyruvate sulfurtransferase